ncbi:hypothetical protein [Rhodococcus sp. JVH1]|uniref:hypothetical protein n=1 Tax=Rhodococcus sp. JVH1 TaxID=745408 RepID=UPI0005C1B2B9|nr:hypothetical protein [Rhodococcus sp. JVH1]
MGRRARTAGEKAVDQLAKLLTPPMEWDEAELLTLDSIRKATDRGAILADLLAIEVAKTPVSTRRVVELAAEIRQTESNVLRWSASLNPDAAVNAPKSVRHQQAANIRWGN